ncbi:hypothetical protein ADUPG1_000464 [Aduncisulcus paluster]|uniref:Uncharacterized protein n=1 Tax=Aduncisulcus paluster TaxID=2918883 RepID=A0ABQ5K6E8_9EUKA|nr:hypothetical protein ADUPG1_000464 [Aduncisulcus paluster]
MEDKLDEPLSLSLLDQYKERQSRIEKLLIEYPDNMCFLDLKKKVDNIIYEISLSLGIIKKDKFVEDIFYKGALCFCFIPRYSRFCPATVQRLWFKKRLLEVKLLGLPITATVSPQFLRPFSFSHVTIPSIGQKVFVRSDKYPDALVATIDEVSDASVASQKTRLSVTLESDDQLINGSHEVIPCTKLIGTADEEYILGSLIDPRDFKCEKSPLLSQAVDSSRKVCSKEEEEPIKEGTIKEEEEEDMTRHSPEKSHVDDDIFSFPPSPIFLQTNITCSEVIDKWSGKKSGSRKKRKRGGASAKEKVPQQNQTPAQEPPPSSGKRRYRETSKPAETAGTTNWKSFRFGK